MISQMKYELTKALERKDYVYAYICASGLDYYSNSNSYTSYVARIIEKNKQQKQLKRIRK